MTAILRGPVTRAEVFCARCADPTESRFTEPGRLAGHLYDAHGMTAGVALVEARRSFEIPTWPPVATVPAQPKETAMPRKDAPKPKYKRPRYACGGCGSMEHTARSKQCPKNKAETTPAPAAPNHFQMKDRGKARKAAASAKGGGMVAKLREEIATREQEIATRQREINALRGTLKVLGG